MSLARDEVLITAHHWMTGGPVTIDRAAIAALPRGAIQAPPVEAVMGVPPQARTFNEAVMFIIALNAINHQFWEVTEAGTFERYTHEGQVGALAMSQAFARAWDSPVSMLRQRLQGHVLSSAAMVVTFGMIPAPAPRAAILNEVLAYQGEPLHQLARVAEMTARAGEPFDTDWAAGLAERFPLAFADPLLKKAQLAVSMIWREARSRGYASPCAVTAFADYQVPNVLRAWGLIHYAPELAARIDAGSLLDEDSPEERAIRGASILAVEALAQSQAVAVADVDYAVWLARHQATAPFHRTRTTRY